MAGATGGVGKRVLTVNGVPVQPAAPDVPFDSNAQTLEGNWSVHLAKGMNSLHLSGAVPTDTSRAAPAKLSALRFKAP